MTEIEHNASEEIHRQNVFRCIVLLEMYNIADEPKEAHRKWQETEYNQKYLLSCHADVYVVAICKFDAKLHFFLYIYIKQLGFFAVGYVSLLQNRCVREKRPLLLYSSGLARCARKAQRVALTKSNTLRS